MLKIVAVEAGVSDATLKLEGRVIGPWVEELWRSCESVFSRGARLTLDLSEVSFVDRNGVELFRSLQSRQVELLNCSPFVATLLKP
jgi:ABC-type transporter Mla MlaB component